MRNNYGPIIIREGLHPRIAEIVEARASELPRLFPTPYWNVLTISAAPQDVIDRFSHGPKMYAAFLRDLNNTTAPTILLSEDHFGNGNKGRIISDEAANSWELPLDVVTDEEKARFFVDHELSHAIHRYGFSGHAPDMVDIPLLTDQRMLDAELAHRIKSGAVTEDHHTRLQTIATIHFGSIGAAEGKTVEDALEYQKRYEQTLKDDPERVARFMSRAVGLSFYAARQNETTLGGRYEITAEVIREWMKDPSSDSPMAEYVDRFVDVVSNDPALIEAREARFDQHVATMLSMPDLLETQRGWYELIRDRRALERQILDEMHHEREYIAVAERTADDEEAHRLAPDTDSEPRELREPRAEPFRQRSVSEPHSGERVTESPSRPDRADTTSEQLPTEERSGRRQAPRQRRWALRLPESWTRRGREEQGSSRSREAPPSLMAGQAETRGLDSSRDLASQPDVDSSSSGLIEEGIEPQSPPEHENRRGLEPPSLA